MFRGEKINRDPERIRPFLDKLEQVWLLKPDLRFGQLVEIIRFEGGLSEDFFYAEDNVWEYGLDEALRIAKAPQPTHAEKLLTQLKLFKGGPEDA